MNNIENKTRLFLGDNIELLRQLPDNSVDSIVTDPPYGLGKEPNAAEVLQSWITNGYHEVQGSGFMGKKWDAFVPQPLFWKEAYRVLKHGGHVLSFFGTRTYDWGVMAMRFAGFEVRDCIQWLYGSGFPKSHNISKAIDKMQGAEREVVGKTKGMGKQNPEWNGVAKGRAENSFKTEFEVTAPATDAAKEWDGWGSALKPANEPIVLARKPLEKGLSIAENVLKHSTGALNIDGCRVGLNGSENLEATQKNFDSMGYHGAENTEGVQTYNSQCRFPANLILTHHPDCECVGIKKVGSGKEGGYNYEGNVYEVEGFIGNNSPNANSNYGIETIENWICVDNCPVKILDEQSGERKGWASQNHNSFNPFGGNSFNKSETDRTGFHKGYDDTGGASRFFMNFDSGGNDSFFYYIYEEINTKICGNILENQKVVGMLNGVMLEAEKYIQSVEQFMFGNKSMENYQMDAKYTISTLTKQMIELKTCNALQSLNIDFYTEELLKTINSLTILSIEDVNFANCINRFKNLLLELVEHIKGIVNHVKSPYYKNGEKTIEKNTTHTIENIGKDQKHRFFYTAKASKDDRNEGLKGFEVKQTTGGGGGIGNYLEDVNSASGKYGSEKAPHANIHPTVKPTELMRYLCRLITPPNGVVLDPFMGSGSTGKAAILEGFQFVGMEMEEEYFKIAEARIAKAERDYLDSIAQLKLF